MSHTSGTLINLLMKKILLSLVSLCLYFTSAKAEDIIVANEDGVNIYYNYINNGTELEVTNHDWNNGAYNASTIVIPEEVTYSGRTRKVTRIGKAAFHNSYSVKSVIIPSTITSIGDNAFAFTSIETIDIPNSVTSIGEGAFDASDLSSIIIPSSITELSYRLFFQCRSLKTVELPNTIKKISADCFMESGIESIVIPEGVTEIGGGAFYCVNVSSKLESIVIPNTVERIGNYAFQNCNKLTSLRFPSNLKQIGQYTFANCTNITFENDLPEGLQSIGCDAFYKCNLTSIYLPSTLTEIQWEAFKGCPNLLTIKAMMPTPCGISASTFEDNTYFNADLFVPKGCVDKYRNAWSKFVFISEIDDTQDLKKCDTPIINYSNKELSYSCDTEGAEYHYSITCSDTKSNVGNCVKLDACYDISVYATASGYTQSDLATAKLYWIDGTMTDPSSINSVQSRGILVSSNNGTIGISGLEEGESVSFYSIEGKTLGRQNSSFGSVNFSTSEKIVIAKIGNSSIKIATY